MTFEEKVDIGIVCKEPSEMLSSCLLSIEKHVPSDLSNVITIINDAPESENFNELVRASKNKYLIYLNDDVEILYDEWFYEMVGTMRLVNVGITTCAEITNYFDAEMCKRNKKAYESISERFQSLPWAASYVFGFNKEKVGDFLSYDERIPHGWPDSDLGAGMCDFDLCLEVRNNNLHVVRLNHVFVMHKSRYRERSPEVHPEKKEKHIALYNQQVAYMERKWGDFYTSSKGAK
jgi:glycosyltransferase involved in cell wall biosynthesis